MRMCTMTTRGAGNEVPVCAPFRPTIYQKKDGEKTEPHLRFRSELVDSSSEDSRYYAGRSTLF